MSDYNYSSDEEQVSKNHNKLLQAVGNLTKVQHIKKVARREPTTNHNEFELIKPRVELPDVVLPSKSAVSVVDLVKTLKGTSKHVNVGKELRNVANTGKVLPKPLEKTESDRLMRSINYDKTKKTLKRWDAVVAQFQSAETQTFPLESETVYINTSKLRKPVQTSLKSELQIAVEEAEAKLRALKGEKKEKITHDDLLREKMMATKEEIKRRRQELLYLKMRQSQKSAKLRLQNKIKSKKYHRMLKQQKLKEQLKDFETLQKVNPEAALEKLESLEKNRILERANLRHKNTGTWAKNNLIKAKYNRDVQKDLAEQLALSRQLTEKKNVSEDEDEEEKSNNDEDDDFINDSNPWLQANGKKNKLKEENAVEGGYRKYWLERRANEEKLKNHQLLLTEDSGIGRDESEKNDTSNSDISVKVLKSELTSKKKKQETKIEDSKDLPKKKKIKRKSDSKPVIENGWIVEDLESDAHLIDKLFDKAEDIVLEKLTKKQKNLQKRLEKQASQDKLKETRPKKGKNDLQSLEDLKFKKQTTRIEIDEQLLETANGQEVQNAIQSNPAVVPSNEITTVDSIKHDDYAEVIPIELNSGLADFAYCDEDVEFDDDGGEKHINAEGIAVNRQANINEAFEDDDIVADFEKDKEEEKKSLGDQLTLSMPGWGSWAGTGISQKSNDRKKLVLDFSKSEQEKSVDSQNKSRVRINENAITKQLKEHLVSNIPFPFKSVKDYEASIRAPVGRDFVPETAFRLLTKPSVITKRGQVIRPMDESELVKPVKRPRSVVEKRILHDAKVEKNKC